MLLGTSPLAMPWPTLDPFLLCVRHDDCYPRGKRRVIDGKTPRQDVPRVSSTSRAVPVRERSA